MNRLWYTASIDKNSPDTIHQILVFGTIEEIKSLKNKVGKEKVKELFLNYPKKVYTNSSLNFIKNYILNINDSIDEQKYLKSTPRNIG